MISVIDFVKGQTIQSKGVEDSGLKEWEIIIFTIVDLRHKVHSQNTIILPPKSKSSFRVSKMLHTVTITAGYLQSYVTLYLVARQQPTMSVIPCTILELPGTILESVDKVGIPNFCAGTMPGLHRFLLCAEHL